MLRSFISDVNRVATATSFASPADLRPEGGHDPVTPAVNWLFWRYSAIRLAAAILALAVFSPIGLLFQEWNLDPPTPNATAVWASNVTHQSCRLGCALGLNASASSDDPSVLAECASSCEESLPSDTITNTRDNLVGGGGVQEEVALASLNTQHAMQRYWWFQWITTAWLWLCQVGGALCIIFAWRFSAKDEWCTARALDRSRILLRRAFLLTLLGPYVNAVLPWYYMLGFDGALGNDLGDDVPSSLVLAAQRRYRLKIAVELYGPTSMVLLSIFPALLEAVSFAKTLVPESSLWGALWYVAPALTALLVVPAWGLPMQLAGSPWLALFVVTLAASYAVFLRAAPFLIADLSSTLVEAQPRLARTWRVRAWAWTWA